MRDDFEESNDLDGLLDRFEAMIEQGEEYFFDSEDFEDIIDYYFYHFDTERAQIAIEAAEHQYPYNKIFEFKRAQLLDYMHQRNEALKVLFNLELALPEMRGDIHYLRGSIYSALRYHDEAINEYKKALKYIDDPQELLFDLGYEYVTIEQYSEAIPLFEEALEHDLTDDYVLDELAMCYEKVEKWEKGIDFFQKFLSKNPFSMDGWYNLGILYDHFGLYEKSIEAFDFALALEPQNIQLYIEKGDAYTHAGMNNKAIENYKEAIEKVEPSADAYCKIGNCYLKLKKYEDAQFYYKLAIKIDSNYQWGWYGLACVYFLKGNLKQALVYTQKCTSQFDEFLQAVQLEGDIYMSLKNYKKAIVCYIKVAKESPSNIDIWFDLVSAYTAIYNINDAILALDRAYYNNLNNIDALYYYIEYLLQYRSLTTALKYIEKAFKMEPSVIDILFIKFPVLKNDAEFLSFVNTLYDKSNRSLPEEGNISPFNE